MAAPYVKRYVGGFVDLPSQTTAVDSAFLNAVEASLLQLLGEAPAADEVGVWTAAAGGSLLYQKITNAQIDAAAAIAKSKLAALNIVDADVAGGAAIAKSKLAALNIVNADIDAAAAIAFSKLAGYPADATKFARGDGTWAVPPAPIFPWNIHVDVFGPRATSTSWGQYVATTVMNYGWAAASNTLNAEIGWDVVLAAGTWTVEVDVSQKNTDCGIFTLYFDGVSKGTYDSYAAAGAYNFKWTVSGIVIPTTAKIRVLLKMTGKNASSTNYSGYISGLNFQRTA